MELSPTFEGVIAPTRPPVRFSAGWSVHQRARVMPAARRRQILHGEKAWGRHRRAERLPPGTPGYPRASWGPRNDLRKKSLSMTVARMVTCDEPDSLRQSSQRFPGSHGENDFVASANQNCRDENYT